MRFPATLGWVSLSAVVGAPCHSWLRAPGAVPRHSWLGSAGGGGVWSLATPGCTSRSRFPATPGWGVRWWRCWVGPCHSWLRVSGAAPHHSWLGSAGRCGGCFRGWGFPVLCVFVARRVRVVPVLVCVVWCAIVVSVFVVVWAPAGIPRVFVCVCVCVCVCGVLVACGVVRCGVLVGVWLVCGVVGPSPLLAEVPVCYSPPLLAGFCCRWWWAFLATPGSGSRGQLPATPGWGPPAAAEGVSAGGGFPRCVCLWRGVCMWCLCWCVWCVFVVSVLVMV